MYIKIHESEEGKIVAACDKELIGKTFDNGKINLDLKTYSNFYKGKEATKEGLKKALKNFFSANLVGKKAVSVALEGGFAQKTT